MCHINICRFTFFSPRFLNGILNHNCIFSLLHLAEFRSSFFFLVVVPIFKVQVISIRDLHEGRRRQTVRAIRPERKLSLYPPSLSPATSSEQPPPPCLHLFPRSLLKSSAEYERKLVHLLPKNYNTLTKQSMDCVPRVHSFLAYLKVKPRTPQVENSFLIRKTTEQAVLILTL